MSGTEKALRKALEDIRWASGTAPIGTEGHVLEEINYAANEALRAELVTCEGCGRSVPAGAAKRWADDVMTCAGCSPPAKEARPIPVGVTDEMVQRAIMAYYAGIADAYDSQEDDAPMTSSDLKQRIGMRAALLAALAVGGSAKVVRLPNPNNGDYYCDGMWDAETVKNAMDDAGVKYEIEGQP
jgi:hypothetical protein